MEPFIEVPRNKWPELRDLFKNSWPDYAVAYFLMDMQVSYPNTTHSFKVFSINGDITKGMVALSDQHGYLEFMIHPINSVEEMEEAIIKTKIVDWSKSFTIPSSNPIIETCIIRISKRLGVRINVGGPNWKHLLDKTTVPFSKLCPPPDTYVDELKPEHIEIVNKTWTFYNDKSYELFESLIRNKLTYVLYSSKIKSPLAWVMIGKTGVLTHFYCLKEYRRRGFGEFIIKFVVNDQLRKGKDILAYTLEGNEKPQRLFDKLGFRRIGSDTWIFINEN